MRYKQLLSEEQLDELRMNPATLRNFAKSPEAQGIQAGFEAELVFTGLGGDSDDDYDMEPDMDADERCTSIQQVMDFFENDEWGYGIHGRDATKLQEGLDEMYWEWHEGVMYDTFRNEAEDHIKKIIEEDDFDWDEETRKQLDMMDLGDSEIEEAMTQGKGAPKFNRSSEQEEYAQANPGYQRYLEAREQAEGLLDDLVQDSLSSQDKNYDAALDEFRDNFYLDDDSGFFSDVGLRWMSDVQDQFDLMWPVMTGTGSSEGGFSESNAEQLADDLHEKLGVKTKVSSGYHSAKRDAETWIFEPDSSLDADDSDNMPVEIVSPPMPLEECLRQMENFFSWAEDNGAYANSSTGFHMGVSLPHTGGQVDYVKLALFLGDEHVLREFGRSGNNYTEAAIKKIRNRVKSNKEAVSSALELMKHNLLELAQKALEINNHGFGKYTSINPQGGNTSNDPSKQRGAKYIEFRSAGGSNYFEDIDKLKNTLLRYAQAMTIAANPGAERREYYKKLYKLISPPEGDLAIDLFSRFATGAISAEQLKKQWADVALSKDAPELVSKGEWAVIHKDSGKVQPGQTYNGYTRDEVRNRAKEALLNNPNAPNADADFDKWYSIEPQNTGKWEIYSFDPDNDDAEETLEIVDAPNRGEAVDLVYDKYNDQKIAFKVRPYYGGDKTPEPELSRRAKLAKAIKAAPPEQPQMWQVVNKKTGEVIDDGVRGTKSGLGKYLRNYEKQHSIPQGDLTLKLAPENKQEQTWNVVYRPTGRTIDQIIGVDRAEAQKLLDRVAQQHNFANTDDLELHADKDTQAGQQAQDNAERGEWEFYRTETGRVIDRVNDASRMQANAVRQDIVRRYGHDDASVGMRRVEQQRYSSYADAERAAAQQNQETQPDVAQNFSTNPNPTVQEPNQVRMPNGVPVWEIYELDSGNVVHTLADHTQREAWSGAQAWLRDIGAEDPSKFSLRAKMLQPGEQNLSRTIAESVFADFDAYFESVITPAKKKLK